VLTNVVLRRRHSEVAASPALAASGIVDATTRPDGGVWKGVRVGTTAATGRPVVALTDRLNRPARSRSEAARLRRAQWLRT